MGDDAVKVNVDNFVRAETARMFDAGLAMGTAGFNSFVHLRQPTPVENQPVIRMNRDTLYSTALVNLSEGATLTLPDVGDRYLSVMVVNEDHHINRVLRDPGVHQLSRDVFDTPFVALSVRLFVDPDDRDDVAAVHAAQDAIEVTTGSSEPYTHPGYDQTSLGQLRKTVLELGHGLDGTRLMFGSADEVDPVRHLIGTALGWGGLPEHEAFYVIETTPRQAGHHRMTFRDMPVDGFWSLSIYNRDGFFEPNPYGRFSVNSVTSRAADDGSVVVDLSPTDEGYANHLYVMDGWNYVLRLYRPHPSVLDDSWTPPEPVPV